MAVPAALLDLTFDGASCVTVVLGATRVPFTSFTPPKVETKTEKVKRLGEARARKRTPGSTEIGDASAELLLEDYAIILAHQNRHGGDLMQFPIIATVKHASIATSYNVILDDCRIVSREGPEMKPEEKGLVKKLGISVMQVWEKAGGIWKCSSFERALPSSQAKALMAF